MDSEFQDQQVTIEERTTE